MAIKTLDENPRTTDTIQIDMEMPDALGCFDANPYKVDNVSVLFF